MMKHAIRTVFVMFAAVSLFSCSGENLELKVKTRLDGQPVAQAKVTVDNEEQGLTGTDGIFSKIIKKKPGVEVEIVVSKEMPGYRIAPWKKTFRSTSVRDIKELNLIPPIAFLKKEPRMLDDYRIFRWWQGK